MAGETEKPANGKQRKPKVKFAKFADKERADYLVCLSRGVGRTAAAKSVGVSYELVRLYRVDNPLFSNDERMAERQANDEVVSFLFESARKGNVAACCAWLYNRDPENWKDRRKPSDDAGSDSFDVTRLTVHEREELRKAVDKALGAEAESGAGLVQRNGLLPH